MLKRVVIASFATLTLAACGEPEPVVKGAAPMLRLHTEAQYRNAIADVFGTQVVVGGSFDPLIRTNGLLTVGSAAGAITPAGLEQYDRRARTIAAQVVSEVNRDVLIPCTPADAKRADAACAAEFFSRVGKFLYRRPLTDLELKTPVTVAGEIAATTGSFYSGISAGLSGMLVSPAFLFAIETTETDSGGKPRLDAYSKASRLSFLLWNSGPDEPLMAAAESGAIHTDKAVAAQVDRMLTSPKVEAGLRAFFNDMLAFDEFAKIEKDSIIYPSFSLAVAEDSREQTLRTILDVVFTNNGDYRDIFTTRKTFMSGPLGRIYRIPVDRPDGGWMPYEFPENDPRAGLLTHVSFAALYSHPGRSSPTIRGRAIRESLLCQRVPDPPGDVDFSLFNDPNSPNKTARDRLTAHSVEPACAGCHKLTDPVGLAMEQIDGAGQYRTEESGVTIDPSGDLDGVAYTDAKGLGVAMSRNPAVPACVVNRLYSYATNKAPERDERDFMAYLEKDFADNGYRLTRLLRTIATSNALFTVTPAPQQTAAVTN
ncbi:MAG: DUF1592 domain-containing protein [Alphaproteobacteria bacterium]|nr:DUF1592 domain-containing protein [Alphaproteobacteria bacterium]